MKKIVINVAYGGFGLSEEANVRYNFLKGRNVWIIKHEDFGYNTYSLVPPEERIDYGREKMLLAPAGWHDMTTEEKAEWNRIYREQTFYADELERDDPILIQVVEELKDGANGRHAELKIVEIPDDVEWQIEEYDGNEWVAEKHRTWA